MKTFTIKAELGKANIVAQGKCVDIDRMISKWESVLTDQPDSDHRDASKDFVIQALKQGDHHTDPKIAEGVVLALTWLTATGAIGTSVIPFMRAGEMTLTIEITNVGGNTFNFRTKLDERTGAAAAL